MTHQAYVTDHPDMLKLWKQLEAADHAFGDVLAEVRKETGREVYTSSGFGRVDIAGLSCKWNEEPPTGWKWSRVKPAKSIIEPRAKGPGAAEAQAVMKRLHDALPQTRQAFEPYGIKSFIFLGLTARSVGLELHGNQLWAFYGDDDLGSAAPEPTEWFKAVPLSQFYLARETDTDD